MASRSSRSSSRKPLTFQPPLVPTQPITTEYATISIEVDRDNPRRMTLLLDGAPSSFIDLDDPTNVVFEYMEIYLCVIAQIAPGPLHVTHLGSAGSSMARAIEALRPNSRQIGIDIDAQLLEHSRDWFALPRSPKLRLRAGDAREQLERIADHSQDVIIRDAFSSGAIPEHLTSVQFTELVFRKLKQGGLYLVNCADKPPLSRARSEVATLLAQCATANAAAKQVNSQFYPAQTFVIAEPGIMKGRRYGNLVLGALSPAGDVELSLDPESATLGRAVRTLAVPAQVLIGDEVSLFAGTAAVLYDPE